MIRLWCVSIVMLLVTLPARAANQAMTYDVYAGGFHVLQSKLTVNMNEDRYDMALKAHTFGFLGKLVKWHGLFASEGWRTESGFRPETHHSESYSGDDHEVKTYRYNKNGDFLSYSVKDEHDDGSEPRDVDPALTRGTTDVMSATLSVMQAIADKGACKGTSEVFDGKRRFRLIFRPAGKETLEASKYNLYGGPAEKCTVAVEPVAGDWHDKPRGWMSIQEQGKEQGKMPTVWFAQLRDDEPAVPVRIMVKTDYGTLLMHLTGYESGDKVLTRTP